MNTGDRFRDLGGGLYDDGRPEPVEPPTMRPPGQMPSCPRCANHRDVSRIEHTHGRFLCGCGVLFNGDDQEWRMWSRRREEYKAHRDGEREPVKPSPRSLSDVDRAGMSE